MRHLPESDTHGDVIIVDANPGAAGLARVAAGEDAAVAAIAIQRGTG